MASLAKDPGGKKRIIFTNPDGNRKTVYLGKMPLATARGIKHKIECLVIAKTSGQPVEQETAAWVRDLPNELADKLANVGLIPKRENTTLGPFVRAYIESRTDVKKSTREHLERVEKDLIDCFTSGKPLQDFTDGDGDKFRLYLLGRGLGENTVRRRCGRAKQFFTAAVRRKLIKYNPFIGLKSNVQANPDRFCFVTRETIDKIMDVCPSNEWRLIIALCRYGGLRCPSEVLSVKWGDVNWEKNRIRIPSPKTEHHTGGESRIIPMFPELRPYLEAAWDEAKPGVEYVITSYRDATQNLRSRLLDFIHWAGVEPWEKPYQNMRSTRETELAEQFPMHVVCKWIGNTEPVAAKHYLQLTDEHFDQAIGLKTTAQNTARITAQSMHAKARHNTTEGEANPKPDKDAKSRKVVADNYLRPLAVSGRKSLSDKDLRQAPRVERVANSSL